jgi:hypothetical protein
MLLQRGPDTEDLAADRITETVRRTLGTPRTVLESSLTFGLEAANPLTDPPWGPV